MIKITAAPKESSWLLCNRGGRKEAEMKHLIVDNFAGGGGARMEDCE